MVLKVVPKPQETEIMKDPVLRRLVRLVPSQVNIFVKCVQTHISYKGKECLLYLIIGRQYYNDIFHTWMTFYVEFETTFTPFTNKMDSMLSAAMEQHGYITIRDYNFGWGRSAQMMMNNFIVITVAPQNEYSQLRYWNSKKPSVMYGADPRMLYPDIVDNIPFTPKIVKKIEDIIEISVTALAVEFSPSNHIYSSYSK